jgi:hypothetical protein
MLSRHVVRPSLLIGAILLPLVSAPPSALADAWLGDPPFALGRESCRQYLSDVASDRSLQQLYDAWLSGYIKVVSEQFDGENTLVAEAEMAGASQWVTNYCRQRSSDSYLTAAVRLLAARERRQPGETNSRT